MFRHLGTIAVAAALGLFVAPAWADDDDNRRSKQARKWQRDFEKRQREDRKRQEEWAREDWKRYEERAREDAKRRREFERDQRKWYEERDERGFRGVPTPVYGYPGQGGYLYPPSSRYWQRAFPSNGYGALGQFRVAPYAPSYYPPYYSPHR